MMRLLLLLTLSFAFVRTAQANPDTRRTESAAPEPREVPDFDGRGPAPSTPLEKAAWVPRVLLSPLYVVTEYLLRRPLGLAVTRAEQVEAPRKVIEFFHFGANNQYVLAPTFRFVSGFEPTVGVYFAANEAIATGNKLYANFNFGGVHILDGGYGGRQKVGSLELGLRGRVSRRNDSRFYGLGAISEKRLARYGHLRVAHEAFLRRELGDQGFFVFATGHRYARFDDDIKDRWRSIPEAVAQGVLDMPGGYENGNSVHATRAALALDSRRSRPESQTGVRLLGTAEIAYDIREPGERSWVKLGGAVTGFVDLSGAGHALAATAGAGLVEEIRGEASFTELLSPAGEGPLSGFLDGYLVGHTELVGKLEYHWPIWLFLDGSAHVAFGNAFGPTFEGFEWDRLRMSWGFGIAAVSKRDHFFELKLGWGTDTFEQGPNVQQFRLVVGGRREF